MNDYLVGMITAIIIAVGVLLVRAAGTWLKAALENERQDAIAGNQYTKQLACETAIKVIDTLVTATVSTIEQQTAKELRQAVKDGTADREELVKLSENAYQSVMQQVTEETKSTLQENMNHYEQYIRERIEQAVLEVKR